MNARALFARLDRLQKSRGFKVAATISIAAAAVALVVTAWVLSKEAPSIAEAPPPRPGVKAPIDWLADGPLGAVALGFRSMVDAARSEGGLLAISAFAALVAMLMSSFVWLGLGLTALGALIAGWAVAWPLMLTSGFRGVGQVIAGVIPLTLAFLAGLQLLRAAFAGPRPMLAIARNLLNEAVRMKVSIVFIVLVIFFLAVIPGALHPEQPLRYRVQQWLQYGTGFPHALLSMLTLFLSAASVSFEQRDRVIWQTMTKPVPPWQYVAGKFLGVMGLNAAMLGVTAAGVFLFTEYLRYQPASGEVAYHVREDGTDSRGDLRRMSDDRRILETQVLVARVAVQPQPFRLTDIKLDRLIDAMLQERQAQDSSVRDTAETRSKIRDEILAEWDRRVNDAVEKVVADSRSRDPNLADTPKLRAQIEKEILDEWELRYRTIEPGQSETYVFEGLGAAKAAGARASLTLRFAINSGSNNPTELFRLSFGIRGQVIERQVALKAAQTMTIDPSLVNDDGSLELAVLNGPPDPRAAPPNPRAMTFPPDGLEILYAAGGYEVNFIRVFLVIWIKLGFIAAVAITASTFLSFPVAALVAMAILIMAESAAYLTESLEYYREFRDKEGDIHPLNIVVTLIGTPVAAIFRTYATLEPTAKLVDGRLIGWGQLGGAVLTIGGWTAATLGLGVAIFRRRELALYSGRS